MNKFSLKDFSLAIDTLLRNDELRSVTVFCPPLNNVKQRVRATRKFNKNTASNEILITFGKPNYEEREFLAKCKKAKCNPRKVWLKFKKTK